MNYLTRRNLQIVLIAILSFALDGCRTQAKMPSETKLQQIDNLFFVYDFTIDKKPVKERVLFLDSIGYQGVTFSVNTAKDFEKLKDYQTFIQSETGSRMKIPAVFMSFNPENKNLDNWKKLADQLAGTKTDIWVIIGKGKTETFEQKEVEQFFKDIADYCLPLNLNVVIYPHYNTFIESAAESLPYLKEANRKNLFTSIHLCHELRAGNGSRINDAVAEVMPYLRLASISGSDTEMKYDQAPGYWDDAIKPLYKGNYDVTVYLEALIHNGYTGPIALHTFGLKEPVDEHFSQSLATWNKMKQEVSKVIQNEVK